MMGILNELNGSPKICEKPTKIRNNERIWPNKEIEHKGKLEGSSFIHGYR